MQIVFNCPSAFDAGSSSLTPQGRTILSNTMAMLRGSKGWDVPPLERHGSFVTFTLPHVFNAASSAADNGEALRALLYCLTAINEDYLIRRPFTEPLYRSGVYYRRTEVWDTIPALYARGFGDCKSLSCALVAERRVLARRRAIPVFRWVQGLAENPYKVFYHILVLGDRGWEDPSKVCGMTDNENSYFKRAA